jgi:multiple sugar transport system permease protein
MSFAASLQGQRLGRQALAYATALTLGVALTLPLVWIVVTSVKPSALALVNPPVWIFEPTLDHFRAVLARPTFARIVANTVIVSLATMVVTLSLGTLCAYGMARFRTGGAPLLYTTLAVRALPPIVLGLPMFVLFTRLGLIDTLSGLTLAYTAFMLPNTIWLMLAFFQDVPRELEEAALVDGTSRFGAFWRVALPVARSGLLVTGFYNLMGAWNHFFYGLTLSTQRARTLPVHAAELIGEYAIRWGEVSAIGTMLILPPIVVVILMQRRLSSGLMLGGIKG